MQLTIHADGKTKITLTGLSGQSLYTYEAENVQTTLNLAELVLTLNEFVTALGLDPGAVPFTVPMDRPDSDSTDAAANQ